MTTEPSVATHPKISERRAAVRDESVRARNRKLMFAGLVVLLVALAALSTQGELLDVDEVRVVGAVRTPPQRIRAIAGVELGRPLLRLDLDGVEDRLLEEPAIAAADASKEWSGLVTIEIVERVPAARFESDAGVILAADDGMVIEVSDGPVEEVPLIRGAMFVSAPGEQVPSEVDDALVVAAALPDDIASLTESVELSVDALGLRLIGGGQVNLGDARQLDLKFDAVRSVLSQVDLRCLEELDVRAPLVPAVLRDSTCS